MYEPFIDAWIRTALGLVAVLTYKLRKCVICLRDTDHPTVQRADIQLGSSAQMSKIN